MSSQIDVVELAFPAMGTQVRLLAAPGAPLGAAQAMIEELEARLTRLTPPVSCAGSTPTRGRTSPRRRCCALPFAPRWPAPTSPAGSADPTLLGAVVRAGYRRSLVGRPRADLREALAAAPGPQPATPHPAAAWRRVYVDDVAGTISRPAGIELDLGGSAKGFAADRAVALLARPRAVRSRPRR